MKKLLFAFITAGSLLVSGCSGDDSENVDNTNPDTQEFNSQLYIDGIHFVPASPTESVMTSHTQDVENDENQVRTFHLIKEVGNDASLMEILQFSLIYPMAQTSINGTYSFDLDMENNDYITQGMYTKGMTNYSLNEGTVTITDLGGNEFKLVFTNTTASSVMGDNPSVSITGFCEGIFTVIEQ